MMHGATNGQGDSRSRIQGDSFYHMQCVDVEFNVLSQNVVRTHVIYHTHHSYNMLKRLLLQCVAVEFLCELPKRF